jgi:hypothetical protein
VRKGERAYKGLFHISQTDVIDDAPDAPDPQHQAIRPIASQQADWDRARKVMVDYETGKLWLERFRDCLLSLWGLVLAVGAPLALFREVRASYVLLALVLIGIGGGVIFGLATMIWDIIDVERRQHNQK